VCFHKCNVAKPLDLLSICSLTRLTEFNLSRLNWFLKDNLNETRMLIQIRQRRKVSALEFKAFPREQFSLPLQSTAKPADLAMRSEDAMARHQNRNRVRTTRAAHGADGFGFANGCSDLAIAFGLAERNLPQFVPDGFLKFRSFGVQRWEVVRFMSGQTAFNAASVVRCQSRIWAERPFSLTAREDARPTLGKSSSARPFAE